MRDFASCSAGKDIVDGGGEVVAPVINRLWMFELMADWMLEFGIRDLLRMRFAVKCFVEYQF